MEGVVSQDAPSLGSKDAWGLVAGAARNNPLCGPGSPVAYLLLKPLREETQWPFPIKCPRDTCLTPLQGLAHVICGRGTCYCLPSRHEQLPGSSHPSPNPERDTFWGLLLPSRILMIIFSPSAGLASNTAQEGPLPLLGYHTLLPHPAVRIPWLSGPSCSDKPRLGGILPVSVFWIVSGLKHLPKVPLASIEGPILVPISRHLAGNHTHLYAERWGGCQGTGLGSCLVQELLPGLACSLVPEVLQGAERPGRGPESFSWCVWQPALLPLRAWPQFSTATTLPPIGLIPGRQSRLAEGRTTHPPGFLEMFPAFSREDVLGERVWSTGKETWCKAQAAIPQLRAPGGSDGAVNTEYCDPPNSMRCGADNNRDHEGDRGPGTRERRSGQGRGWKLSVRPAGSGAATRLGCPLPGAGFSGGGEGGRRRGAPQAARPQLPSQAEHLGPLALGVSFLALLCLLVLVLVLLLDAAEARRPAAALRGRRPVGAFGVEQPAQRGAGHRGGGAPSAEVLLAHVARVALALQALEVAEGSQRGRALVRPRPAARRGRQHHGLWARLVAVDPGEDARVAPVRRAVGDARQQVGVRRPAAPGAPRAYALARLHADAVRPQRQLHLGAPTRPAASPDLAHGVVGAAVALGMQGDGVGSSLLSSTFWRRLRNTRPRRSSGQSGSRSGQERRKLESSDVLFALHLASSSTSTNLLRLQGSIAAAARGPGGAGSSRAPCPAAGGGEGAQKPAAPGSREAGRRRRQCPVPGRASFTDAWCPAGLAAEMPGRRPSVWEQLPPGVAPAVREARRGRGWAGWRRPLGPNWGDPAVPAAQIAAAGRVRPRARLRWGLLQASRLHLPGLPTSPGGTASSLVPSSRPPLSLSPPPRRLALLFARDPAQARGRLRSRHLLKRTRGICQCRFLRPRWWSHLLLEHSHRPSPTAMSSGGFLMRLAHFASCLHSGKPAEVAEQCSGKILSLGEAFSQATGPELGGQSLLQRLVVPLAWTKLGGYSLRVTHERALTLLSASYALYGWGTLHPPLRPSSRGSHWRGVLGCWERHSVPGSPGVSHRTNTQVLSVVSEQLIWGVFQIRNEPRGFGWARPNQGQPAGFRILGGNKNSPHPKAASQNAPSTLPGKGQEAGGSGQQQHLNLQG
ncbi:hypothetical protein Cadr_000013361 [Camelus dromedarius]|uniref:Uncharacterized protein n=1 Tax=Camelus dromedarius TaxID=9838 RepID=A0A5N4DDH4_CAMDR|nr:hypothetical protein Cadr_000013361 [Camelus dromedarius]